MSEKQIENYILNYLDKLQNVYSSSVYLSDRFPNDMKDVDLKLERSIKKLKLLSSIYDRYVIAVAGFQGAGKSTLMNSFLYDNPKTAEESWFPLNLGVGENLPVLLTLNKDVAETKAFVFEVNRYTLKNSYSAKTNIISREILNSAESRKIAIKPERNQLLLEVMIPVPKFFESIKADEFLTNISFLLLPGFEVIDEDMDEEKLFHQEYMRMSLAASATSIVVIDPKSIAQKDKEDTLKEIVLTFKNRKVLFNITREDSDSIDQALETIQDNYNISSEYILTTGTKNREYTQEKVNNWRKKLIDITIKAKRNQENTEKSQVDLLKKIIKESSYAISELERLNKILGFEEDDRRRSLDNLLKKYDESAELLVDTFTQIFSSNINSIIIKTRDNLDYKIRNRNLGEKITDKLVELWKGPETIGEMKKYFDDGFNKSINEAGGVEKIKLEAVHRTEYNRGVYTDLLLESSSFEDLKENSLTVNEPTSEYRLSEKVIQNIQFLAGQETVTENTQQVKRPNEELELALKLLPYLVFDLQRYEIVKGKSLIQELNEAPQQNASETFLNYFGKNAAGLKGFLLGIGALLGADYFPDGSFDNIGGIFSGLFGTGAAAEGATIAGASTAVSIASGAVLGLVIAKSLNDSFINQGLKKMGMNQEFTRAYIALIEEKCRLEINRVFIRVRELVTHRLTNYSFRNELLGEVLNLEHSIKESRISSSEMGKFIRNKK